MRKITREWAWLPKRSRQWFDPSRYLARGLPATATVTLRVQWPLYLFAFCLAAQLLMPDPVWTTVVLALAVAYLIAWLWVRLLARGLHLERQRDGTLLVAGDSLDEQFSLVNESSAAAAWLELLDDSNLPGYDAGRVLGVGPHSALKWRSTVLCRQRGLYHLGPCRLLTGDPLRLFELTLEFAQAENILIHPRVCELPRLPLPRGYSQGDMRSRRPLLGTLPATSIRGHSPDDDLRYVHWPSSARQGRLMVRELEQEPSGDLWIVADSFAGARTDCGVRDSLETTIIAAASLAAQFLEGRDHRGVGLMVASGDAERLTVEPPQSGRAQLWRLLAALAPVAPAATPLHELLRGARDITGSRSSLVVVTAQLHDAAALERWTAQLVRLHERGLTASALLITTPQTEAVAAEQITLLARYRIPALALPCDAPLTPVLTHRRRRKELRSTPRGGIVAVEIEEDVA